MNNSASNNEHIISSLEENQIISMLKNQENPDIKVETTEIRAVSKFNQLDSTLLPNSKRSPGLRIS